jgi:hypothetical protein
LNSQNFIGYRYAYGSYKFLIYSHLDHPRSDSSLIHWQPYLHISFWQTYSPLIRGLEVQHSFVIHIFYSVTSLSFPTLEHSVRCKLGLNMNSFNSFLLEITEMSEFKIISGSVSLSDHVSPITSSVPKPLWCISYTVSLRESLCWR